MSALPNPRFLSVAFRSHAEAAASRIAPDVAVILVGECVFARDLAGTALTTQGGATWSPVGRATLAHWGAYGSQNVPAASGALSEPTGEDQARIAAALLWCGLNGRELYGDPSRVYGVTGPLSVGGASPQNRTWGLCDLNLYVKSWTAAVTPPSGDDPDAWVQDAAVLTFGPNGANPLRAFTARNIHVDCARLAGTGVRYLFCGQSNFDDIRVDRQVSFGHDVGRPAFGAITPINVTDCHFSWLRSREYWFSTDPADGFTDWTVRTSCGLRVSGSDCSFAQCTIATAKFTVALARGFNVGFNHCQFWGNPDGTSAPDYPTRTVFLISKFACNFRVNNCRLEDGRVVWNGAKVPVTGGSLPAFQGQFIGCSFSQYNNAQLVLVAHDPNETATNLIFVGNRQRSDQNVSLAVAGSGTWGDFAGEWASNTRESGGSWTVQGKALVQQGFEVQAGGRIKFPALSFAPTAATSGRAGETLIDTNGDLCWYTGTVWKRVTGTVIV